MHTVVVLHFTHDIKRHDRSRGENIIKMLKQFIIKTYKSLILYKPVDKYHFTMTCIRALVMSAN